MTCEKCGKEMIKVGSLEEQEINDFIYINEKYNCVNQALSSNVISDMKFTDGQVFEYFKACYDQLAQAKYLHFIFERDLKKRLGVKTQMYIDFISYEVFIHPEEEE